MAAWSGACIFVALFTTNPAYRALVLAAAFTVLVAAVGLARLRRLLLGAAAIVIVDVLLNFVSAHLGRTVLFALPEAIPALGGPYTLEALAFGVSNALTIAAAIFAAAPFSLMLEPHDVMDALPNAPRRSTSCLRSSARSPR